MNMAFWGYLFATAALVYIYPYLSGEYGGCIIIILLMMAHYRIGTMQDRIKNLNAQEKDNSAD